MGWDLLVHPLSTFEGAYQFLLLPLLISCGNHAQDSSVPSSHESASVSDTSSAAQDTMDSESVEVVVTVPAKSVELEKNNLIAREGGEYYLNATVAPNNTTDEATWSSSDAEVCTVTGDIHGGAVKALKKGTATITLTVGKLTATCAVTVRGIDEYDAISSINAEATTYSVRGVVDAVNKLGFVLTDGTDSVYVQQGAAPSVKIGDYISVEAASSLYHGMYQLSCKKSDVFEITEMTGTAPIAPTATELTPEIASTFVLADDGQFSITDLRKYTWETTAVKDGSYWVTDLHGSSTKIEPVYLDESVFPIEDGKKYKVEGYFTGYSTNNSYASYLMTKLTLLDIDATSITVTAPSETLGLGKKMNLKATLNPVASTDELTWSSSYEKVTVMDGKVAVASDAEVNTEVTITAASKRNPDVKGTVSFTVVAAPEAIDPVTITFDDSFNTGFTSISSDKWTKTVSGVTLEEVKVSGTAIALNDTSDGLKYTDSLRIYKNHTLSFTAPEGERISKLTFVSVTSYKWNATNVTTDSDFGTIDVDVVTDIDEPTITFTMLNSVRLSSVVVEF